VIAAPSPTPHAGELGGDQSSPGQSKASGKWNFAKGSLRPTTSKVPTWQLRRGRLSDWASSGDPYLSFPKRVGLAPSVATKKTHGDLRDRYKTGLLAIQYGIKTEGLAARLNISDFEAYEMITQHHELFAVYWHWVEDWRAHSFDTGAMQTSLDWQCVTGITEFNERSIGNWPVQSTGADILRLAVVWATRHELRLIAPVHDALVLEAPLERIDRGVSHLQEIMRRASRVVLNATAGGTVELRTDATIVRYPDRYSDKRGEAIWRRVLDLLADQERREKAHG
jgi:DNA polymerase I